MRNYLFISLTLSILANLDAQNSLSEKNWITTWQPSRVFIENKGQFGEVNNSKTLYAIDNDYTKIYFSNKGLSFVLFGKNTEGEEKINEKYSHEKEVEEKAAVLKSETVNVEWLDCNPNATILAEEKVNEYFNYSLKKESISNINGFKKITYVNLYPNIDVVYTFHPSDGIKYSFVLHPGADISLVKMKYSGAEKTSLQNNGDFFIKTELGNIVDHAPITFYENNHTEVIPSAFIKNGNTISFTLKNYDHTRTLIIDPWTQTPTLPASNCVWECEKDSAGNVYAIGGDHPMKLVKFNNAGTPQWVFSTAYDTSSSWLGTLLTDKAGNSYVTCGSIAAITKVNTTGGQLYSVTGGNNDEYWGLAFNCDQTKLVAGGTRLSGFSAIKGYGTIFQLNPLTGNVITLDSVGTSLPSGFGINNPDEVRSLCSAGGNKYYFLTFDSIGAVDQNISLCSALFKNNSTHNFAYKCDNWKAMGKNSGLMAIKASAHYLYTHGGDTIYKRSLINGSIISSAIIPGGIKTTSAGYNVVGNSGVDIDSCGNVYAGSANALVKYDSSLNLIASVPLSFSVYDVAVSYAGEIIVAGATGTATTTVRTGYVQSINMSACNPIKFICCDANICAAGPFCINDAPDTLSTVVAGGTWSGAGINSNGVFNPSTAGVGTHTINYGLSCGIGSTNILVKPCVIPSVCTDSAGVLTVSGGTGPYNWYALTSYTNCSGCPGGTCVPPICNGVISTSLTLVVTGSNTFSPTGFPIKVTDSLGNSNIINLYSVVPACGGCGVITSISQNGNVLTANQGGATYQWLSCNGGLTVIAGATNQSYTVPSNGNYAVIVTKNSCTDTSYCKNTLGSSTNTITGITKFVIYPNPSDGTFSVVTNEIVNSIAVTDVLGNEILSLNPDSIITRINLSQQPNGVYFIKVVTDKKQVIKKILVNK